MSVEKEKLRTEIYDYGGLYYKVIEPEAVHSRLQTDVEFAESYFGSKEAILSVANVDNGDTCDANLQEQDIALDVTLNTNEVQFKWDHQTVQLLLEEYLKLKNDFRNPLIRKSSLWAKIKESFLEYGHDIALDSISTKFRNLKKTFLKIYYSNNQEERKGDRKISWEYYNYFFEIFKDDDSLYTGNFNRQSMSAPDSCGPPSYRKIAPTPPTSSAVTLALASALATSAPASFNTRKAAKQKASLLKRKQHLRRKRLKSEELRIQEIQHLAKVIRENNIIQKERNYLLKEFISKCKCNEAIKLFM